MQDNTLAAIDGAIDEIGRAATLDQVRNVLRAATESRGFDDFAYWRLRPPQGPHVPLWLTSYPADWTRHYTAHGFKSCDMVASHGAATVRPFLWQDLKRQYQLSPAQQRVFHDGAEIGLKAGGSIPIHGPRVAKAAFSVCCNGADRTFEPLFQQHRHELQLIATYAHERILLLERFTPVPNMRLTARELEVLTWTAKGKTRWEIGEILHISEETVKKHLLNASARLQAGNKTHAVAVALLHGIILP